MSMLDLPWDLIDLAMQFIFRDPIYFWREYRVEKIDEQEFRVRGSYHYNGNIAGPIDFGVRGENITIDTVMERIREDSKRDSRDYLNFVERWLEKIYIEGDIPEEYLNPRPVKPL